MKKKLTLNEKRIKKNKRKNQINIAQIVLASILILILISSEIFKSYLKVNEGFLNYLFLSINAFFQVIFGKLYWLLVFTLFIYILQKILDISVATIKEVSYLIFFLLLASFSTIMGIDVSGENSIIDAGQKLLEYAFLKKGGGIVGAIISIPTYKLSNLMVYKLILLILSLIFLCISFSKIVKLLLNLIIETYKYYHSEEYFKKKQILEAKKKIEEEERELLNKERENKIKNTIITLSKESFDKKIAQKPKQGYFSKTEYYSKEELEEQQKRWDEYIREQNKIRQKEDLEKRNEELEQEKVKEEPIIQEEKIPIKVQEIKEEKEEKEEEVKPNIIDDDLKKSIEEVFVYRKVDEQEKIKMKKEINENIRKLEKVLKEFGVDAKVVDYATGPTITRYEITIPTGVRVNKVTQLSDEISMYLEAESVRFEAPIPGKATIGIETPNKIKENVYFSNLIHDKDLENGELSVVLGKNIVGKDKIIDIAKMPHLLIAGQTGSGKSVAINTIVSTLISKKSPDEVKFILVDPKMVELMPYNGIPHLLVPVIIDPEQAAIALKWAVSEMEDRYKRLAEVGIRNIKSYNKMMPNYKMPYIVIIIDELADLMMVSANSVETSIARIAQKARAVGIHLIVATQRPSTDVITGMIKANLPSRISFALRSQIDSRTILDQIGAEKLLGKGDMLLLENGSSKLERIQGAYISDEEVLNLTTVLKSKTTVNYNMDILEAKEDEETQDPYYVKALEIVEKTEDKVSISLLQRELKIGFNRASRLNEELKNNGILDDSGYKINI
ncbi:DNA translocase FtsK [Sneathia sanguinegens]|uniref:DNA translocase FtsK n=1 Tax=Sneathia sanguinegens TaxID=40543 RepID=A0ABT7HJT3_9FUSO|nr:DNA translocase FtsK [Sneathia sanguinegens]MDK9580784.1 DNA translocase FtsK [Sneathia sanguinegens]